MNHIPTLRVALSFGGEPDPILLTEAGTVSDSLYGNPYFPTPPVLEVDFDALVTQFREKLETYRSGGPAATALKNEIRRQLIAKMKELAFYVQVTSNNVMSVLLSSGFKAVSTNRAMEPLPAPVITRLVKGQSGQLLLSAAAVRNARGYERQIAPVAADGTVGEWTDLPFTTGARRMLAEGLTPGHRYAFRLRAMGGSTGHSDWSGVATEFAN